MKITLDSNPDSAPCCIRLVSDCGQDKLIQTDWDYPAIASVFGWSIKDVQPPAPDRYSEWQTGEPDFTADEIAAFEAYEARTACEHSTRTGKRGFAQAEYQYDVYEYTLFIRAASRDAAKAEIREEHPAAIFYR